MKTIAIVSAASLLMLTGCATQRTFTGLPLHHEPVTHTEHSPVDAPVTVGSISDSRPTREIDAIFSAKPNAEVARILQDELTRSGLFATSDSPAETTYRVEGELTQLAREVPNHKGKVKTAFTLSFLTGGLGGLAYGSTSTPVYGDIELKLRVIDPSGQTILDRTYTGRSEEKMALLKSDTPKTISTMSGKALSTAISAFIADLENALATAPNTNS